MTLALKICALSVAGGMRRCKGSGCFVDFVDVVVVDVTPEVSLFVRSETSVVDNMVVDDNGTDDMDDVVDEIVSLFPIFSIKSTFIVLSRLSATVATSSLFITKILQTTKNVNTTLEN